MAYSRTLLLLAIAGCAQEANPEPEAACAAQVAFGDLQGGSAIATDDTWIYAIDSAGMLLRAPLGGDARALEELAYVGDVSSHQLVVDADDLWIKAFDGTDTLLRVDKTTGSVEVVDSDFLWPAFAIDREHVYWSSVSHRGVVRRLKRGGPVEILVPDTELAVFTSLTVASGRLYVVDSHDQLYALDLITRDLRPVESAPPGGLLDLVGPDDAGRLYLVRTTPSPAGESSTTISQWSSSGLDTELVRWNGPGLGSLGTTFAHASDGLYLAVPQIAPALMHFAPGDAPETLFADSRSQYGARFAIGTDAAYVSDGKRSIYRLPLTGGPYPLCP